jgi:hypothetical protein
MRYVIDPKIIDFTTKVLSEYGKLHPSAEGLVYWSGKVNGTTCNIISAFAPRVEASRYGIYTTHESNAQFVEYICDHDLKYISQVHSHPSEWVNHSRVDDEETAFRSEGLLSVVVPSFAAVGMLPLTSCGIHRFNGGKFRRVSSKYIKKHFFIKSEEALPPVIKDFRYE